MDLKTYIFSLNVEDREVFAKKCGTSRFHLQNAAYGKPINAKLAVAIERESKRQVTRQEMFPGSFKAIWPELKAA
jgi:DNA-binding transcriptional regulator YdaS (Cro superfamily)